MAKPSFSLPAFLGILKRLLANFTSPIAGFTVEDAKVKSDNGNYSALYTFGSKGEVTDINGNPLSFTVLLTAMDAKTVLKPILTGINNLQPTWEKPESTVETSINIFAIQEEDDGNWANVTETTPDHSTESMSTPRSEGEEAIFDDSQETLLAALLGPKDESQSWDDYLTSRNGGLLGTDFANATTPATQQRLMLKDANAPMYAGKRWSWGDISHSISYALECTSPNNDPGTIVGQPMEKCSQLIGEYLEHVGAVADGSEVQVDAISTLFFPLMSRMKGDLEEYFDAAYAKYILGKSKAEQEANQQSEPAEDLQTDNTEESAPGTESAGDSGEGTTGSKHINVTLKKIVGSTGIEMTAIKANYNPTDVLMDMDEIIAQPEFMDNLTGEFQNFSIDVDEDGFDIEPCEEYPCNPCEGLGESLQAAITAYRNLYIIHWMSSGNDMMKLHLLTEELYTELIKEIDTLGELMVEKCGSVLNVGFPCSYTNIRQYTFQEGLVAIKPLIQSYIDCIDYAYPNQSSDVQSTLDEWLRFWNKEMNYFLKNQEE